MHQVMDLSKAVNRYSKDLVRAARNMYKMHERGQWDPAWTSMAKESDWDFRTLLHLLRGACSWNDGTPEPAALYADLAPMHQAGQDVCQDIYQRLKRTNEALDALPRS